MKKIIISIFFLAWLTEILPAQGTLQFSQVLLVTSVQTVPTGKVWKVESVLSPEVRYPLSTSNTSFPSNSKVIVVNGANAAIYEEFVNGVGLGFNGCCGGGFWMSTVGTSVNSTTTHLVQVSRENTKLPIWLPAGATLAAGPNVNAISAIEFNIAP